MCMDNRWLAYILMSGFLTSCAIISKQPSVIEPGRLLKLSKQSRIDRDKLEEEQINKLVSLDKLSFQQKSKKTFELPDPRTEESLYSEVLKSYQSRDI